jgi:hypothetical protein
MMLCLLLERCSLRIYSSRSALESLCFMVASYANIFQGPCDGELSGKALHKRNSFPH